MVTRISHNPAETHTIGHEWGQTAAEGAIITLSGDLGAGKTQLVKGLASGLGITARVHSPTFTLLNIYSGGRLPLHHLDLYRLSGPEQVEAAGLTEYLGKGLTVIEWPDRLWPSQSDIRFPGVPIRRVFIEVLGQEDRQIIYEDIGP